MLQLSIKDAVEKDVIALLHQASKSGQLWSHCNTYTFCSIEKNLQIYESDRKEVHIIHIKIKETPLIDLGPYWDLG